MALGAQAETFSGLTGLGDLVLTATGELSRNRRVGLEIGAGRKLADILASGITAEACARAGRAGPGARRRRRAAHHGSRLRRAVRRRGPMTAVSALLARDARYESADPAATP